MRLNLTLLLVVSVIVITVAGADAASPNIPLQSTLSRRLEVLAGCGLVQGDFRGIRPLPREEVRRLVTEARSRLGGETTPFCRELLEETERSLREERSAGGTFTLRPFARARVVALDGVPRSFERSAHDKGDDGVFGIGSSLRPENPYPSPARHHGRESTPLLENDNGSLFPDGVSAEVRAGADLELTGVGAARVEPVVRLSSDGEVELEKGYVTAGGDGLSLLLGRDENWLGFGERGSITLGNNMKPLTMVKLYNPSPLSFDLLSWLGEIKYALILSRLDATGSGAAYRHPWYYAAKLSVKPVPSVEVGFNLGRQVGGPGVKNGLEQTLKGLIGGTADDNSNGMAGFELRWRVAPLRNTELYAEFSGEDTAAFWPIVESYLAGVFVPQVTDDGRNSLRLEYFRGNAILYTHSTFPQGYLYRGVPLGHSQGGGTEDLFASWTHWFTPRLFGSAEYAYTTRGSFGLLPGQAREEKHLSRVRGVIPLPIDSVELGVTIGAEWIRNLDLTPGVSRANHLGMVEVSWRY